MTGIRMALAFLSRRWFIWTGPVSVSMLMNCLVLKAVFARLCWPSTRHRRSSDQMTPRRPVSALWSIVLTHCFSWKTTICYLHTPWATTHRKGNFFDAKDEPIVKVWYFRCNRHYLVETAFRIVHGCSHIWTLFWICACVQLSIAELQHLDENLSRL